MGSLERRARKLEEEARLERQAAHRHEEGLLSEAITRLTYDELVAMHDYFHDKEGEAWAEEDALLLVRLLEIKEEVRAEREAGDFPWRA